MTKKAPGGRQGQNTQGGGPIHRTARAATTGGRRRLRPQGGGRRRLRPAPGGRSHLRPQGGGQRHLRPGTSDLGGRDPHTQRGSQPWDGRSQGIRAREASPKARQLPVQRGQPREHCRGTSHLGGQTPHAQRGEGPWDGQRCQGIQTRAVTLVLRRLAARRGR